MTIAARTGTAAAAGAAVDGRLHTQPRCFTDRR